MAVTWGVGANREASVYCSYCYTVFALNIPLGDANAERDKAQADHHCTPPKPWRPKEKE